MSIKKVTLELPNGIGHYACLMTAINYCLVSKRGNKLTDNEKDLFHQLHQSISDAAYAELKRGAAFSTYKEFSRTGFQD